MTYWILFAAGALFGYGMLSYVLLRRDRRRLYMANRVRTRVFVPHAIVKKMDVNSEQFINQQLHGEQGYYE